MSVSDLSIYFATSNEHKFKEAKEILSSKISIAHFYFKHNEIRSDSLADIAIESVNIAYAKLKKPVFVEDTGLFISALNGFPATFSAWVINKIGSKGILKLMHGEQNRVASFKTCIAFSDGKDVKTFFGDCSGAIANKQCGKSGFGFDSIFIPADYKKTFAEDIETKNKLSHRYQAISKLADFLIRKY